MKKIRYLWCYTMLLLSFAAYAESVSCGTKAKLTVTEQTVCHNSKLSKLDDRLNKLYQQALQVSSQPDVLKQDQLVWLRNNRDLCANDKKCLTKVYQSRLQLLATVIANPKSPIPQYYPVRWDHSIDLPPAKPGLDYPKFINLDHSSNIVNRGLNSKNPCVQMFLKQSEPAKQSNVADYQFTSNTLDELPPNIGFAPNLDNAQLIKGFLAGQSRKVMDPSAKIIYLRPYEIIFMDTINTFPTNNTGADAVKLKIIAWGHFKDKNADQLEDILLYINENEQITNKQWGGWADISPEYIIATKKMHETRLRIKGFYWDIKGKCSLISWSIPKISKEFGDTYGAPLIFVPTFYLQFPR